MRCRCTTTWENLPDGIQRRIDLLRFAFLHFDWKERQDVWQRLILQSWFEKQPWRLCAGRRCWVPGSISCLIFVFFGLLFVGFCRILVWFGRLFCRLVSAFRNFSWVTFVGQAGIFYISIKIYQNFMFELYFQAMLGPHQQNWASNGQVQHWNKVRRSSTLPLWHSDCTFTFRYAVVGVVEEFKTSLAVMQVHDILTKADIDLDFPGFKSPTI